MTFELQKNVFKRLKANFGLLQVINQNRAAELDITSGFQIHYNDNYIYILTGDCVNEGASLSSMGTVGDCSSDYYMSELHLLKINTKENTLQTKTSPEILLSHSIG